MICYTKQLSKACRSVAKLKKYFVFNIFVVFPLFVELIRYVVSVIQEKEKIKCLVVWMDVTVYCRASFASREVRLW